MNDKRRHQLVKTFKVKEFLNESSELLEYLLLPENKRASLQGDAGIGKTVFGVSVLAPTLINRKICDAVLFTCPYDPQIGQMSKSIFTIPENPENDFYKDCRDNVIVIDENHQQSKNPAEIKPVVICTYDRAETEFNTLVYLLSVNLGREPNICVIPDESHLLGESCVFRGYPIAGILNIAKEASRVLCISATPSIPLDYLMNLQPIRVDRKKNAKIEVQTHVLPYVKKRTKIQEIQIISDKAEKSILEKEIPLVYIDNWATLKKIAGTLVSRGVIKSKNIGIYHGEGVKGVKGKYSYLYEHDKIESHVKLVLCTKVLNLAVNIKNKNFRMFSFFNKSDSAKARDVYQLCLRLRDNIKNNIVINVELMLSENLYEHLTRPIGEKEYKTTQIKTTNNFLRKALKNINGSSELVKYTEKQNKEYNKRLELKSGKPTISLDDDAVSGIVQTILSPCFKPDTKFLTRGLSGVNIAAVANEVETEMYKYQRFTDFKDEFLYYTGVDNCIFNEPIVIKPVDIDEKTMASLVDYESACNRVKRLLLKDLTNDFSNTVDWAKENLKDSQTKRKLGNRKTTGITPIGYEKSLKLEFDRYYIKKLVEVLNLYIFTDQEFAINQFKIELNPETPANKKKMCKSVRVAISILKMFYSVVEYSVYQKDGFTYTRREKILDAALKNGNIEFSHSVLASILDGKTNIFKNDCMLELSGLEKRVSLFKDKVNPDSNKFDKNNTYHNGKELKKATKAVEKYKARFINKVNKTSKEISFVELKKRLEVDALLKHTNIDANMFIVLIRYFSNCKLVKGALVAPNNLEISFDNFEKEFKIADYFEFYKNGRVDVLNNAINELVLNFDNENKRQTAYEIATEINETYSLDRGDYISEHFTKDQDSTNLNYMTSDISEISKLFG